MDTETQHLPQDLINEILLRLPVKSLVCFKAVCKSWQSHISSPDFARSHFELATPRLMIETGSAIQTMDLDGPLHSNMISEPINHDFSPTGPYIQILGSCRGFVLLQSDQSLYLWNPSTRVDRLIPSCPLNICSDLCGFGYDSSKDDYLVVMVSVYVSSSPFDEAHWQFFSLRANMWIYGEGTPYWPHRKRPCHPMPGLLFNNAIHWLEPNIISNAIIAFDLVEKRLVEIPIPDELSLDLSSCDVWVNGRFLSLSFMENDTETLEIWVMEKYNVQSSWTKTLVLSTSGLPYLSPLCSTKSGEIIMDILTGVEKYTDKGEKLEHCSLPISPEHSVPMYTESIFSLPAYVYTLTGFARYGVNEQS